MNFLKQIIQNVPIRSTLVANVKSQNNFGDISTLLLNQLSCLNIQERCSSLWQMHRKGPHMKERKSRNPLDGNPFMKGVVLKTLIRKPKKPNSANRKCVLVRLSNGKEMVAYIPGIGHNLQMEHHGTLLSSSSMPVFLPVMRPHNPGHDYPENTAVLDLCVRKRPPSPNYPYDYKRQHTSYTELTCLSPKSDVSDVSSTDNHSQVSSWKFKANRPFKAYPKDPLSLALLGTTHNILGKDSVEAYAEFRDRMLSKVQGNHIGTNKNMRRTQTANVQNSDPTYWEKRKKNNEAAKRSRDARRAKEDEIAIRCAFLEQENIQLKFKVAALESERERVQNRIYH